MLEDVKCYGKEKTVRENASRVLQGGGQFAILNKVIRVSLIKDILMKT